MKKPINCDYSALPEKTETISTALKFKVGDRVRITGYTILDAKNLEVSNAIGISKTECYELLTIKLNDPLVTGIGLFWKHL